MTTTQQKNPLPKSNETRLSVAAIEKGTVIDHITAGQALKIIRLLNLACQKNMVTLGLNLPSKNHELKDIIKVENRVLSPEEANQVAILSPAITINIIEHYRVIQKFKIAIPETIARVIVCPNTRCVTNHETVSTFFTVKQRPHSVQLRCRYCEKTFAQDEIKEYNT